MNCNENKSFILEEEWIILIRIRWCKHDVIKKLVFNIKYNMICLITSISELMSPRLI